MHRRYAAAAAADAPVAPASAPSPPAAESVGETSQKKRRRVNRPPCLPPQDGDVVEGSVADDYTPCRNRQASLSLRCGFSSASAGVI